MVAATGPWSAIRVLSDIRDFGDPRTRSPDEDELLGIRRPTPEEAEKAEQVRKDRLEVRQAGLRQQMEQWWFRAWLYEYLADLGTWENIHAASPTGFPDPMATQFYVGRKAAGWQLWDEIDRLVPDLASKMRREAGKPLGAD
jgi:hypothetical protein